MKVHVSSVNDTSLKNVPYEVPDNILKEHQAQINHGQTLHRLNERGGMGVLEILDNLFLRKLQSRKETQEDVDQLNKILNRHKLISYNYEEVDNQELYRSKKEDRIRKDFVNVFKACPIPDVDILQNLGLFISSKNLSRMLFMDMIYKLQLPVHGVIMEFGTRWGQNLVLFSALRGIYEPFNRIRKIIGFDTFEGFPSLNKELDNLNSPIMKEGGLACTPDYEKYLEEVMLYHENDNPLSHIKKFEIRKGDSSKEIIKYLEMFPETIISLAFFDFDIYQPTVDCLLAIKDRLVKGSVVVFDELCDRDSPGETQALREVFELNEIRLKRLPHTSRVSYFIYGE